MSPEPSATPGPARDVAPPPEDTLVYPPTQEHRPSAGWIVLASLLVLALLVAGGLLLVRSTQGGSESAADGDATDSPAVPGDAEPAPSEGVLTAHAAFGPDQVLTGLQHIEFSSPVSSLRLKVPPASDNADTGEFHPRVDNLQILLDLPVPLRVDAAQVMALTGTSYGTSSTLPEVLPRSLEEGAVVTVDLPLPATEIDIVYAASGVVHAGVTASAGTAPALMTPLVVTRPLGLTTTLRLHEIVVSDVTCGAQDGPHAGCGSASAKGYTVDLGREAAGVGVVAQVELTN